MFEPERYNKMETQGKKTSPWPPSKGELLLCEPSKGELSKLNPSGKEFYFYITNYSIISRNIGPTISGL
jgi:hypothetical protein